MHAYDTVRRIEIVIDIGVAIYSKYVYRYRYRCIESSKRRIKKLNTAAGK